VIFAKGQTRNYGQIDIEDLKLTTCDFEKNASGMVLYDRTEVTANEWGSVIKHHTQIKILTEKGLKLATVSIYTYAKGHLEKVKDLQGQTLNLENNTVKATPIDKNLFYEQKLGDVKVVKFSFPNVKVGSVIEYEYRDKVDEGGIFPQWIYQRELPVKYASFDELANPMFQYRVFTQHFGNFDQEISEVLKNKHGYVTANHFFWAVKNVPSFTEEPFATSKNDYIQKVEPYRVGFLNIANWQFLGHSALMDPLLKTWLNTDLNDDQGWIEKTRKTGTDEETIAFLFNKIKTSFKWNGNARMAPDDKDLEKIWKKKTGTSAAINFILYNFLRQAGLKCSLLCASTRDNGKVKDELPSMKSFNTCVLQITTVTGRTFILDASDKHNAYDVIPEALLNCRGMLLDPEKNTVEMIDIEDKAPAREALFVNAKIQQDGKLTGTVLSNSFGPHRVEKLKLFDDLGEAAYKDALKNKDNNITILSLKRENLEVDSLPLAQTYDFKAELPGTDDKYIFVNPNMFSPIRINPFISDRRYASIDFANQNTYIIRGRYQMPAGCRVESLPKSMVLSIKDGSISFRRTVEQADGIIALAYTVTFNKSVFQTDEYPAIHDFYKKMFEMLNEQIVLKKI